MYSRIILVLGTLFLITLGKAQEKIPLVRAYENIQAGIQAHDSANYDRALLLYSTVFKSDTNYVLARYETMLTLYKLEKFDQSIEIGKKISEIPSDYQAAILNIMGNAFDELGNTKEAIATYQYGLEKFPHDQLLNYNIAKTYFDNEYYKEAYSHAERSLNINPFHANSHLLLGDMMALMGHKTRSLLSYLTYLAVNTGNNSVLVKANDLVNNAYENIGSVESIIGKDDFYQFDVLINSRAAIDKGYKKEVKFDAAIVGQTQLVLSKLKAVGDPDDLWNRLYVPYLVKIYNEGHLEAFTYLILASSGKDQVVKWRSKNSNKTKAMSSLAGSVIAEMKNYRKASVLDNYADYSHWYFENGRLNAIGNANGEQRVGPWEFYYSNGRINARGVYKDGQKVGPWEYYYSNGSLNKKEVYSEEGTVIGEVFIYHENGNIWNKIVYNEDGQRDGFLDIYNKWGVLIEKYPYRNGEVTGRGEVFTNTGVKEREYVMDKGRFVEDYTYFFPDGSISYEYNYVNDTLEGDFFSYFADGSIEQKGTYLDGEYHGNWEGYFANGKLRYSGEYDKGQKIGQWKYYSDHGTMTYLDTYEDGYLREQVVNTLQGKKYRISKYEKGKFIGNAYYDVEGKVYSESGDPSGTFSHIGYSESGDLLVTGSYLDGKKHGLFTNFHANGNVESKEYFEEGVQQGQASYYYSDGTLKYEYSFKDDIQNGYYRSYYKNGQIMDEGWVIDGQKQQLWISYFMDGSPHYKSNYLNDKLHGEYVELCNLGDTLFILNYQEDLIDTYEARHPDGEVLDSGHLKNAKGDLVYTYRNGQERYRRGMIAGLEVGTKASYFPNGQISTISEMIDGKENGVYKSYYPDGKLSFQGTYSLGELNGKVEWYDVFGNLSSDGYYMYGTTSGEYNFYHDNGQISSSGVDVGGLSIDTVKYYDHFGELQLYKIFDDRESLVEYGYLSKNGELLSFSFDSATTKIETYFQNGTLSYSQDYKNELISGIGVYYDSKGGKEREFESQNGDYHGVYKRYHLNGQLSEFRNYYFDELHGERSFYYDSGQLKEKSNWFYGTLDGEATYFDEGGNVQLQMKYKNDLPLSD